MSTDDDRDQPPPENAGAVDLDEEDLLAECRRSDAIIDQIAFDCILLALFVWLVLASPDCRS